MATTTTLVSALPDFTISFEIETDASSIGVGAVLQQNKHLIPFISKTLSPKWATLLVYEKELLVIVFTVQKWEEYLMRGLLLARQIKKS